MNETVIIKRTQEWLETMVIGLNLCPFAKKEFVKNTIRYSVSHSENEKSLLEDLLTELKILINNDEIETSLVILSKGLKSFYDYNQFLALSDILLEQTGLSGEVQIASFHPHYQFEGTDIHAVENYTNRSPYPMLHLLRESSVEQAVNTYPDIESIPQNNVEQLNSLGLAHIEDIYTKI